MTDFVQSNVTKSRFFELADPIADVVIFNTRTRSTAIKHF